MSSWAPWATWDPAAGAPGPLHGPRRDLPGGRKAIPWPEGAHPTQLLYWATPDHRPPATGSAVVLTEGEKAADAVAAAGYLAAGTVCGAPADPDDAVVAHLAAYRVILAPDADDLGRGHMTRLSGRLERAGVTALYLVDAPADVEPGWDLADVPTGEVGAIVAGARELPLLAPEDLREVDLFATDQSTGEPDAVAHWPSIGRSLADFLAESDAGVQYVLGRVIPDASLVTVLGRPESFKSMGLVALGLACAGAAETWLGLDLGPARPFVYVSNEKTATTIRERFRRMTDAAPPTEPVIVVHRQGVTFGDASRWSSVVELVRQITRRTGHAPLVVLDTLASLAGAGFDENSGKDMAVVLAAVRQLTDLGATVILAHHPAKHGDGDGGIRMRGHTSLWGETDVTLEFRRPDRAVEAGMVRAEPKDGDLAILRFTWDRETFLLAPEETAGIMTARTIADMVALVATREPVTSEAIFVKFTGHGRTAFLDRLGQAVDAQLVARVGRGKGTRYQPGGAYEGADDSSAGVLL